MAEGTASACRVLSQLGVAGNVVNGVKDGNAASQVRLRSPMHAERSIISIFRM
jgi:hypothetical protein